MGKRQHQKDKLYVVASEFARDWGGFKKKTTPFKALPFYCCGLTLLPFDDPVCTSDGIVYNKMNLLSFLNKYSLSPSSGDKISCQDVYPLLWTKNTQGEYCCPISSKDYTQYTHIVANKKSGYVYAYDTIDTMNRKTKYWNDLITGEPFKYTDIIHIQDPNNIARRNIENFYYIVKGLQVPPPLVKKKIDGDTKEDDVDTHTHTDTHTDTHTREKPSLSPSIRGSAMFERIYAEKRRLQREKDEHTQKVRRLHKEEEEKEEEDSSTD
eukprot:GHVR01142753.1.p1 GENE.GHVR01142753.1~~GHVR01142753.1.p1  ORF type:complete len:267 (-),score=94.94 GHVR01142753.1:135-935(-)